MSDWQSTLVLIGVIEVITKSSLQIAVVVSQKDAYSER